MDQVLPWLWLAVGAGLVAFSIWGVKVCWAIVVFYVSPATFVMRAFIFVPTWCVLFLPFAYVGFRIVRSTRRQMVVASALRRLRASATAQIPVTRKPIVEILPPTPVRPLIREGGARVEPGAQQGRIGRDIARGTGRGSLSPLNEATKRRMDELGVRAAKITGTAMGSLFLGAGLMGFVMAWIHAYRPPDTHSLIHSELASFRLAVLFLVACGLAVVLGGIILRSTFKRPDNAWLGPLHAFTAVVSRRAAVQERAQPKKNGDS